MKAFVLFALLGLAAAAAASDEEQYYDADDTLDIAAVVADRARFVRFVDCYLDRAPCSIRAAGYKAVIHDALATKCRKCTSALKHLARLFMEGMKKNFPEDYILFKRYYDPEDKYVDDFEKEMEAY